MLTLLKLLCFEIILQFDYWFHNVILVRKYLNLSS